MNICCCIRFRFFYILRCVVIFFKSEYKLCSFALLTLCSEFYLMLQTELFDGGESESCASLLVGIVGLPVGFEDVGQVARADAYAVVGDDELLAVGLGGGFYADADGASLGRELSCVAQEVVEYGGEGALIEGHIGQVGVGMELPCVAVGGVVALESLPNGAGTVGKLAGNEMERLAGSLGATEV